MTNFLNAITSLSQLLGWKGEGGELKKVFEIENVSKERAVGLLRTVPESWVDQRKSATRVRGVEE